MRVDPEPPADVREVEQRIIGMCVRELLDSNHLLTVGSDVCLSSDYDEIVDKMMTVHEAWLVVHGPLTHLVMGAIWFRHGGGYGVIQDMYGPVDRLIPKTMKSVTFE